IDVADKDTRNDTDAATHIETVPSGTPLTEEATPPETVTPAATETPIEHATEFPLTTTEPEHEPVAEKVAEPEPVSEPLDQPAPRFDAAPAAEPAQDKTAPVEPAVAAKPEETVTLAPADKHDSTSDTTAPAEPSRKKRATYELSDNHELIPPEKKAAKQQAKSGFLPTAAAVLLVILAGGGTTAYLLLQPDRSGDKPEIKTTAKSTTPTTVTPARDKPAAQNSDVMTEGDRPAPADSAADRRDTAGAKDNQSTYRAEIKHDAKGVTIELDAPTDEPVLTEPADGGDVATATADREKSTPSEQQKTGKKTGNKTKSRKVREITHIVVKGDTLWDIAQHYVNNPYKYPELAKLSNIKNPDRIYPGDRVRIIHKSSSR
ncbi:MAG: LysM peptidoglycan-binding domain-containing protein, partial [Gammaproteobacteria bacterium]|nr:LysM peptidoglycan-binding domain-containing protein [Gammaproteobacteria bacterium]